MKKSLYEQLAQALQRWPYRVHTIPLHKNPHIEEKWALKVLREAGESVVSGITTAKLMLTDAGMYTPDGRPAQAWEREGYLPIGCWGSSLDEHTLPIAEQERGECAATQAARLTGADADEALRAQCAYVAHNDSRGQARPWELAAFARTLNINEKGANPLEKLSRILEFTNLCFDAALARDRKQLKEIPDNAESLWLNPGAMVAWWMLHRYGGANPTVADRLLHQLFRFTSSGAVRVNGSALDGWTAMLRVMITLGIDKNSFSEHSRMIAFAREMESTWQHHPFGFSSLIKAIDAYLYKTQPRLGERQRWELVYSYVLRVFDVMHATDVDYDAATEECNSLRDNMRYQRGRDDVKRSVVWVVSNNPQILRALRDTLEPTVIVLKTMDGHASIHGSKHLPMADIMETVTALELANDPSVAQEYRPRWYHHKRNDANSLLNGGPSADGVTPTNVEMYQLVEASLKALKEYKGAPRKPRANKKKVVETPMEAPMETTLETASA